MRRTAGLADEQRLLLADIVDAHAARDGNAPALLGDGACLSYAALAERSNRYARWALAQGWRSGDTVGLMLENCPDHVAIWLGLSRVGVVVALLGPQLAGTSLAHCVAAARPVSVIVGVSLAETARAALSEVDLWVHGGSAPGLPSLDAAVGASDGATLAAFERPAVTLAARALLIYTSGTTGLPKAANVSHFRIRMWSEWFAGLMDVSRDDRLYDCLPMCHSVGGVVAVGAMLAAGASVVVRERFSATRFWDEVAAWDCTIFQYIGELCRYLVNQAPQANDRAHRLRLCCGNGLRADVWKAFQDRFAVPHILEFYAATEGSFSLFNGEGRPGSIGRVPGFMAHRSPVVLVRFDAETEQPLRVDGLCVRCAPDEVGEALGRLAARGSGLSGRFEGYASAVETEKKILRDVFERGDAWFRTGDLMRKDAQGFYYFVDRVGDTFRWKGENVACSSVEAALCACPGVLAACVYGVVVPGAEGRAGMAALVVGPDFDLAAIRAQLARHLPSYARPLFLRLRARLDLTGTFKPVKRDLVRDGFDPDQGCEPLYLEEGGAYVPLDAARHARLVAGQMRV